MSYSSPPWAVRVQQIAEEARLTAVGVAVYDYQGARSFELGAERPFHAASVIKVAVLLAVCKAAEEKRLLFEDPLHVRNRFTSIVDGSPYRIERDRDGDHECHRQVGRTLPVSELARVMIVRSSNIATNLLLDLVGLDYVAATLRAAGVTGVKMVRGVEDQLAFARGLNNEMSAAGACQIFQLLEPESSFLSDSSRARMREILLAQEFNSMIPARLPKTTLVAHKTGEISTHSHDAGIVYPVNRQPYVVAIFTESASAAEPRSAAVARISAEIFAHLTS